MPSARQGFAVRRLRVRSLLGFSVALVLVGVSALAGPAAVAVQVDPGTQPGRAMPLLPVGPPQGLWMATQAPGYVGYDGTQRDEYAPAHMQIRRTDGSLVRDWVSADEGQLFPGGLSSWGDTPEVTGGRRMTVHDIETGAVTWTVDIPTDEQQFWNGASWVLTTPKTSPGGPLVLRRPGFDPLTVPGLALRDVNNRRFVANATTLAIQDYSNLWTLDLASGALHLITSSAPWDARLVLTRNRIFWIDEAPSSGVSWADVDGSNPGSVVVSDGPGYYGEWFGFGDRLAVVVPHPGDPASDRGHFEPIDLSTGAHTVSLVDQVGSARDDGEGTVILSLDDTATGRLVSLTDDGRPPHPIADLPPIGRPTGELALSGGRLAAGFGDRNDDGAGPVMVTSADGNGTWSNSLGAGDQALPGALVAARGDVVETHTSRYSGYPTTGYTVSWPGGHRDIEPSVYEWRLARGGSVVEKMAEPTVLADTRSGAVLGSVPFDSRFAVDGRTLWQGPDGRGNLVATDLDGAAAPRTVSTGVTDCAPANFSGPRSGALQVAGRFALIECGSTFTVVDLQGVLAPQPLARTSADDFQTPGLGNGFVAWKRPVTDPSGVHYAVAVVQDLGVGHGTRTYGPMDSNSSAPWMTVPIDDGDRPQMAYVDTTLLPRVVDLDWLMSVPTTWHDTAAPTVAQLTGGPRTGDANVSVSWSATDTTDAASELPSGVASYDVRYQSGPVGGPYGDWVLPAALQSTTDTTTKLTGQPGQDTCFSVRARDRAGNVSDWSPSHCTAVDGTAPTLTSTGGTPRTSPTRQVTFSWTYTDPAMAAAVPGTGLASYDVRYQQAPRVGAPFGAWATPASWQATATPSVTLTAGPGVDTCVQVRARDQVGNLSDWSASRCSAVDATAPSIVAASAGPLIVAAATTSPVSFSYKAIDNVAVASYDVGYRYAPPGGAFGALVLPSTWQATSATTEKVTLLPGGEVCFVFRARDRAGNVSGWSASRCATVPWDDRALAGSYVTRTSSTLALGGTVSRLNGASASLHTGPLRGAAVALVVIRGPRQGAVDVYAGSHLLGRVYLSSATWRRDVVSLPAYAFSGVPITIRSRSTAPSLVDALAIIR